LLEHCWDEFDGARKYADECAKLSFKLKYDRHRKGARFDGLRCCGRSIEESAGALRRWSPG
jgi:hypothetical protein